MRKKILGAIALLAIVLVITININLNNQGNGLSDMALANVEALAGEALPYESIGCQTAPCKLELGGGWFTGSVKKDCIVLDNGQYSSCSSVPCGEVFYGCN
jgi:hypothetical protein